MKIQKKSQNKANVLVVEDNIPNQLVVKAMLDRLGCLINIASDGKAVIEMSKKFSYDVILMDLQMPEMNGFEATAAILADENNANNKTPIIALTANVQEEIREKCLNVGMKDYLSKPIKFLDLQNTLKKWVPSLESSRRKKVDQ